MEEISKEEKDNWIKDYIDEINEIRKKMTLINISKSSFFS